MIFQYALVYLFILHVNTQVVKAIESKNYEVFLNLNNHSNILDESFKQKSKVNFNDYLFKDPLFSNVIDVNNVFKDSDIFYECDKHIPNLKNEHVLKHIRKNPETLLCMGISHILLLNSMLLIKFQNQSSKSISLPFPKTKSELDTLILNYDANNTLKGNVMCEQHKVSLPTYETDVVDYIKILNPYLDNVNNCKTLCLGIDNSIEPVCAFIMEANSIFNEYLKQVQPNSIVPLGKNLDSVKEAEENSDNAQTIVSEKDKLNEVSDNLGENKDDGTKITQPKEITVNEVNVNANEVTDEANNKKDLKDQTGEPLNSGAKEIFEEHKSEDGTTTVVKETLDNMKLLNSANLNVQEIINEEYMNLDNNQMSPIANVETNNEAIVGEMGQKVEEKTPGNTENNDQERPNSVIETTKDEISNAKEEIGEAETKDNQVNTNGESDVENVHSDSVPINKGNIALVKSVLSNITKSTSGVILNTETQKEFKTDKVTQGTNSTYTPTAPVVNPIPVENSNENTDDNEDYKLKVETTSLKVASSTKTLSSTPEKVLDIEENNALEAENDAALVDELSTKKSKPKQKPTKNKTTKPFEEIIKKNNDIKPDKIETNNLDSLVNIDDNYEENAMPIDNAPAVEVAVAEGNPNNDDFTSVFVNKPIKQQIEDPVPVGDIIPQAEERQFFTDDRFQEAEDSHFFYYFVLMSATFIILYVVFYNKRKLLALALEGRSGSSRRSRSRRHTYSRVNTGFDDSARERLLY